jgi:benzoyl-CoA reductase/2-hydroxyglutaryl-CoA dehydratase subunit BcrC/BadD/HgdB
MHTDFEKRYARTPVRRPSEKILNGMRDASRDLARRLQQRPGRLPGLSVFETMFTTEQRLAELRASDRRVAGTYCYFVPEELLRAFDVTPVRLCSGFTETIAPSEEVLPRDICPLVKSSFGSAVVGGGYLDECDVIILPTSCDAKTKLGEYLADYKPVWLLNLPSTKDYAIVKPFWVQEIKRLKTKLENWTGRKLDRKKLKDAIGLFQKRSKVYRELYELRRAHPGVISHQDWLMAIQASFYADVPTWIAQAENLVQEIRKAVVRPVPDLKVKLLLTGAPVIWPNYKILNIIDELGAAVVADEMCSGHQRLWDYAEPDEWTTDGMLEALASRYLFPATCPCFTGTCDRVDKLLKMAEDFNVDGVIYHDLRLCQLFDMERDLVSRVLKERKMPMLTLHTDYGQEDVEQLKTRVEAFLEIIR